jgi:hypothetical protein
MEEAWLYSEIYIDQNKTYISYKGSMDIMKQKIGDMIGSREF